MPMAPLQTSVDPETHTPYNEKLFSQPKAQFVVPSTQDTRLASVLQQASAERLRVFAQEALAKLPVVKRKTQGITHIGFFDKGVFTGGILLLSTVLSVTGVATYYGFGLVRSRVFGGL